MGMVKLLAGTFNNTNVTNYWLTNEENDVIGKYAIVRNKIGYDLVKITGIVYTTTEHVTKFSGTKIENMKEVMKIISNEELGEIETL